METKICTICKIDKPLDQFQKGTGKLGRRSQCKQCCKEKYDTPERSRKLQQYKNWRRHTDDNYRKAENEKTRLNLKLHIEACLFRAARARARQKNIIFTIQISDIILPEYCPLLGIKLEKADWKAKSNSYSLDRIDSTKGYIPGNIWVISRRANLIKNDATVDELVMIANNLQNKIGNTNSSS